jgi:hypothetical protein
VAWLPFAPATDAELRQGDLIVGIPFPTFGSVVLTTDGLTGAVGEKDAKVDALVLDHCCTVEQKHIVLLARIMSREVNEAMMQTLINLEPGAGKPYSRYMHLLDPHEKLPAKKKRRKIVNLLDRVQLSGDGGDAFQWLCEARVARMDVVSRAHLRLRLAVHFGRAEEEEDAPELRALGLDDFGRPEPTVIHGFPPSTT